MVSDRKWKGATDLLDDIDVVIKSARYVSTQFGTQLVLTTDATERNGNVRRDYEMKFKCSSASSPFVVADGGARALHESGDPEIGFHPKSAIQGLIDAAIALGAPLMTKTDDPAKAEMWVGSRYHFNVEVGRGKGRNDAGEEEEFKWEYYKPTAYLGEADGATSTAATSSPAASAANGSANGATEPNVAGAEAAARVIDDFYTWLDKAREQYGFSVRDPRVQEEGPESIWAKAHSNA